MSEESSRQAEGGSGETPSIKIGAADVPVWPEGLGLSPGDKEGAVQMTRFTDVEQFHGALIEAVLKRAAEPANARQYSRSLGGTKLYHVEDWPEPGAQLLNARALSLFRRVLKMETAVIDMAWANVYRQGDYVVPHSHVRSEASVVYCLDPGEAEAGDANGGRFAFVDPRYGPCCRLAPGYMTNPFMPRLEAGSMLIFPSQLVHFVNPYWGERPRITISWNINRKKLEGSTLEMLQGGALQTPAGA